MAQKKIPLINSAHGSDTRNIINELIKLFNGMGYTYNEALKKAHDVLDEAQKKSNNVLTEAERVNALNKNVQQQINTLIAESGTSDAEVLQARIDGDGNEYPVLKERLDESDAQLTQKAHKASGGELGTFWESPVQPSVSEIIVSYEPDEFINATYETLRNDFPAYISKEVLGQDAMGNNIYKYIFEPEAYEKTVILGAGLHGMETQAIAALYRFMYHVCYDYDKYPQLNYAREKVRFIILPLQNPSGFNLRQTENSNDVNLNRNFEPGWDEYNGDDKGTAPLSELESQYIDQVLADYKEEADTYIDIHNADASSTSTYYCVVSEINYNYTGDLLKIMEKVTPKSEEMIPFFDYVKNPLSFNHAINKYGFNSFTPEIMPARFGKTFNTSEDFTFGFKWMANVLLYALTLKPLKTLKLNQEKSYVFRNIRTSVFQTKSSTWEEITELGFTFTPERAGTIDLKGNLTLLSTDPNQDVYAVATITQSMNPAIETSLESSQRIGNEVIARGARSTLPLNRLAQVLPKSWKYGDAIVKIFVKTNGGTAQLLRSNLMITFRPNEQWSTEEFTMGENGYIRHYPLTEIP